MRITLKILCLAILMCIGLVSCAKEDEPASDQTVSLEAETITNVSYGEHNEQIYDLYLPEGRSVNSTKTLVLIHGGGWTAGDKSDMNDFVASLQTLHPYHAIVNMNYVLADATTPAFPNQFLDVKAVIEKLSSEAEELQISDEFGLIGGSAGAHIALMYDAVYDTNDQVKFVANIVGPTDFTDPFFAESPTFPTALSLFVDEDAYPEGNYAEAVSPVYQASPSTSPVVMFYGSQDPLVPVTNGSSLDTALSVQQVSHSFTIYEGGHGDDWSDEDRLNLQVQISEYINTYLVID